MIDWKRLAEPQADRYDTAVALRFATAEKSPRRGELYVRRGPDRSPTIFDGTVAVRHLYPKPKPPVDPHFINGPIELEHVHAAVDHVRHWSIGFEQFQLLMDTFNPIVAARSSETPTSISSSHSDEDAFGTMYATCHDPVFLAECFVHEMAHQKLRAFGVGITAANTLIANDPSELFVSPIIKDRKRPMSAVFHATYSFAYVAALDIHVLTRTSDPHVERRFAASLGRNLARVREGLEETRRHIRLDAAGQQFLDGFFSWTERLVTAAENLV